MGKPKAPDAPDPQATAAAQTSSNIATANNNAQLNRIDQFTPYGSSTYSINGTNADGTPKYSQTVSLSPQEQQLFDKYTQGQNVLGDTALNSLGQVQSTYANKFDPSQYGASQQQAQDAAYAQQKQYLDPQYDQLQGSLDAKLANQGLSAGDSAYDTSQGNFARQRQQAYESARNSAIGQGNQEQQVLFGQGLTQYNQPLNTYNALTSGAQVQNPSFNSVPGVNQANTDVAGITQQGYQNQLSAYQQQQQGINNLFSLGGSLGAAAIMSDRRTKRDIKRVGETPGGYPLYAFRYIKDGADGQVHIGVMADEIEPTIPEAVIYGDDGFARVDYSRVK
jgi:hypothetical protein